LVVAYEYNSQEPRFYSKYFMHQDPAIYDVPIGNATGSSSAAPTFFNPHQVINGYGYKELQIDGGVICNNPALYAYEMARDLYGYKKIRVLSLGTG
jgi:patatin-like phospholipase/acyl hydrolase